MTVKGLMDAPSVESEVSFKGPPKKTQTATPTMASPPGMGPTIRLARLTSRAETPERSITNPARMKNGMASSGNLEMLE